MPNVAVVFGSTTGNTGKAAKIIRDCIGKDHVDVFDVSTVNATDLSGYPALILGTSTWGMGDLQDDWEMKRNMLEEMSLQGKTVALFGFGDQSGYPDSFVNGMGTLYQIAKKCGADFIGSWPTEGYEFTESTAVSEGSFVGLPLDDDNQPSLSMIRIRDWCALIRERLV